MIRNLVVIASILVLPLALLLFAQWPLRDAVQAYSLQANDVAQILFAFYCAVAITAASRAKSHLALSHQHGNSEKPLPARTSWRTWAVLVCVAPWAVFLLWTATPQMLMSIATREIFSEGLTPGYFMLRIALVLLALLVLMHAVVEVIQDLRLRFGLRTGMRQPKE